MIKIILSAIAWGMIDQLPITINGKHYGVEVRGRVFDRLSPQGIKREDWLKIFIAKVKSL
ncbi:hypothetical protein MICAF_2300002 [Microcystis aeruginosa PCC 9807]|jgi:hypothetical protein|uniref:Tox-PL-2 domain-containing protein n=1 Tax=Microcystis aeruginosa PCC 9807 TaxID=1160283 RepID=I4H4A3_MICAE|nr:papain fold toxin domain-containing protein [Microcystis aeruginosa]MCZ8190301.1 hypothetical protein [Microcystis sp. LE19-338.1B]MCZ8357790.1 hypothetical protein [Microcystis sp. LE19-388.1G]CCI16877.1 hypothetical protein MICAF_2300002 [Microcystis aeruginosa PCC 9807]